MFLLLTFPLANQIKTCVAIKKLVSLTFRVLASYGLHKKLSQFDSFQYLSKFHASWWKFGKTNSLKFCKRWWFVFQSSIMLWNQSTYEWYNSPTKYYFDLESLVTFLQFQQKDWGVLHLIIDFLRNFTDT